jgi:hypothetical protein
MARRRRRLGLLGWLAVVVIVVLVIGYLQQHHIHLHLPKVGG